MGGTWGVGFADLQEFVAALERDRDLTRVRVPVDPHLEVTGIVQRVLRDRGPALLFEKPSRGRMPLLMNAFGTSGALTVRRYRPARSASNRMVLDLHADGP